jgi:hypothetical protein
MAIMHFVGESLSVSLLEREEGDTLRIAREKKPDEFFDMNPDEWFELLTVLHMIETGRHLAHNRNSSVMQKLTATLMASQILHDEDDEE